MGRGVITDESSRSAGGITEGQFIRNALSHRNWTIAELAARAQVNYSNLTGVLRGVIPLSVPMAVKVAIALGLPPDEILVVKARHDAAMFLANDLKLSPESRSVPCSFPEQDDR